MNAVIFRDIRLQADYEGWSINALIYCYSIATIFPFSIYILEFVNDRYFKANFSNFEFFTQKFPI